MRLLFIATFIFIFNTAFMPLLGMAHESSHESHEGKTQITWSDDGANNGLFQMIHDAHHDPRDLNISVDHLDNHQCHHISVIGMAAFVPNQALSNLQIFNMMEPLFSIQSFPALIEYPPKKT